MRTRTLFPLNQQWFFHKDFHPSHTQRSCSEEEFEAVTLPHSNCRVPYSGFDDKIYQFVSSYRRHFRLPETLKGQRVFVDFAGIMTAATVAINGTCLGEHKGGYVPFSFDLTDHIDWAGDNVLSVQVDSTERKDIPPFGGLVDYLCYGGIYREVQLRIVNNTYIKNVFVKPRNVLTDEKSLEIDVPVKNSGSEKSKVTLSIDILDEDQVLFNAKKEITVPENSQNTETFIIQQVHELELWDIDHPKLYSVKAKLLMNDQESDWYSSRFGFRRCEFTPEGFKLNGEVIQLRGLNRHQSYPWVGYAMPARVQRQDADILKHELHLNIVRTSHYPQSTHFLDRCDEVGLLVFEEIPGWQHIGDEDWQDLSCRDVEAMITRDFNHPSIVLWGVRINESPDNDSFYARTSGIARRMDDTRQTAGVRCHLDSNLLEDVFTINDFSYPNLYTPNHPLYMITEYAGHTFPTKHYDNVERITEHTYRHASIQSQAADDPGIAGAVGWCAFDYNTHRDFGSGDRICHHGVYDMFRIPKYAAGVYKAQCDPSVEVVLEPAFPWCIGDQSGSMGVGHALINSNCDLLKLYLEGEFVTELEPDRRHFPGLEHPPFVLNDKMCCLWGRVWNTLQIDGYLEGEKIISRTLCGSGIDHDFQMVADSHELVGDGIDTTRVWFRVTDEYGNQKNQAFGCLRFEIEGPGELIGDNPLPLPGGCGAVWIRSTMKQGTIRLTATHTKLGSKTIEIEVNTVVKETLADN